MEEKAITTMIKQEIESLANQVAGYIESEVPMHEMEKGLLKQLLHIGYVLLVYVVKEKVRRYKDVKLKALSGLMLDKKGLSSRQYLSLFGQMEIERPSYWAEGSGKVYYIDEVLQLPVGTFWSYNLQELVGESASESDYAESVRVVNKVLGLSLSGKSSERNICHLGGLSDKYYEAAGAASWAGSGSCYSVSFDGKGVPKIKEKAGKADEPQVPQPKKRLAKGEKPHVMQMATVAVCSSFMPKERSAQDIIKGLMYSPLSKIKAGGGQPRQEGGPTENDNRWHQGIHRRAFVGDQQKAVDYGMSRIRDQVSQNGGRFVVPIDAGIGLEEKVMACVEKYGLKDHFDGIILDILHVSEYAWDAATAIFGETSRLRHSWVETILEDLLESNTQKVIKDLQRTLEKGSLSQSASKQLAKTIAYFTNHQHKMDYKAFLQKGYPVSSALVEAACGHLVKDRMEQSGMRWSTQGAQHVLDARAVKQNGDMSQFMQFVIEHEHKTRFRIAA